MMHFSLLFRLGFYKVNSYRMTTGGTLRKISGMVLQFKNELIEKAEDAIDKIEVSA